jgi:hypothetical protein
MYKVNDEMIAKAEELGLEIFASDNPKKKIEVYDENGLFLYHIGDINYPDFYLYRELENLKLVPKGTANKRRELYYERHQKNIEKGGKAFVSFYLLWK